MNLFNWFSEQNAGAQLGYEAAEVTGDIAASLATEYPRQAIHVRPYDDNGGIEAMGEVLDSLHDVETRSPARSRSTENTSPAHAFEIRYSSDGTTGSDKVLTLQYVAGADSKDGLMERQLQNYYPNSQMERREATLISADEGQYVAGAEMALRKYTLFPIQCIDLDGWRTDPTGSIMTEMVGAQNDSESDCEVVVQVMFKPADRGWRNGVENGHGVGDDVGSGDDQDRISVSPGDTPGVRELSRRLNEPIERRNVRLPWEWLMPWLWEYYEVKPTKNDRSIAGMLEELSGKAWRLCARVFAVSDDPEVAEDRAASTAGMFRNYYEYQGEQTLIPQPLTGSDLSTQLDKAAGREFTDRGIVKPQTEVQGLVNVPEYEHVSTNKLRWSLARPGDGVPPATPRFDFVESGLDPATATDDEKQVAMLEASGEEGAGADGVDDDEEVFWYGLGTKHGVEAGVYGENLDAHQFVGGATRKGKTTWLTNYSAQCFRKDHGGLIVDPKGKDADEFLAEWPDDRDEDDLIIMDLGDEDERIPRFNFMEIPGEIERGSHEHSSYVEALADDTASMVADAGGSDNYLGSAMKRVTKAVARAMAKSEWTFHFLDLAVACSDKDNLDVFANWMDEERIEFIRATIRRFAENENLDLNPLAGRFDEYVHNDAVRRIISAREPTFSIHEAVAEGKWVVVRFPKGAGKTEKRLVTTALVRRTYCSQRALDPGRPFNLVLDEFDSIVTQGSGFPEILSEAGAFKFRCTLACQAPSNQLPERVQKAVENQCETFISFNPGGTDDARLISGQHSVDEDALLDISKYKFYMRTHDEEDDKTYSYMVDGFPPAREVRARVAGTDPRSDEEIQAMKQRSFDRYAEVPESAEEQAEELAFNAGRPGSNDTFDMTGERTLAACRAVYDATIRAESDDGFIPFGDVVEEIRHAVASDLDDDRADKLFGSKDKVARRVVSEIEVDANRDGETPGLTIRDGGDGPEVRPTTAAIREILDVGDSESSGGLSHYLLLRAVYEEFVRRGAQVTIPSQGGDGSLPDAIVEPGDDPDPVVEALTGGVETAIEAEKSTGDSKPGQTVLNLAGAVTVGQRCLFAARPDDADRVWSTLVEEPTNASEYDPDADETLLLNSTSKVRAGGEKVYRPGSRISRWSRDETTGEIILRDDAGDEHARFDDAADVFNDADAYPESGRAGALDDDLRAIRAPVIPEYVFDDEPPAGEGEAWNLLVVDGDENLGIYRRPDADAGPLEEWANDGNDGAETDASAGESGRRLPRYNDD